MFKQKFKIGDRVYQLNDPEPKLVSGVQAIASGDKIVYRLRPFHFEGGVLPIDENVPEAKLFEACVIEQFRTSFDGGKWISVNTHQLERLGRAVTAEGHSMSEALFNAALIYLTPEKGKEGLSPAEVVGLMNGEMGHVTNCGCGVGQAVGDARPHCVAFETTSPIAGVAVKHEQVGEVSQTDIFMNGVAFEFFQNTIRKHLEETIAREARSIPRETSQGFRAKEAGVLCNFQLHRPDLGLDQTKGLRWRPLQFAKGGLVSIDAKTILQDLKFRVEANWHNLKPRERWAYALGMDRAEGGDFTQVGVWNVAEHFWTLLANVSGGDWKKQSVEWQESMVKARDAWNELLLGNQSSFWEWVERQGIPKTEGTTYRDLKKLINDYPQQLALVKGLREGKEMFEKAHRELGIAFGKAKDEWELERRQYGLAIPQAAAQLGEAAEQCATLEARLLSRKRALIDLHANAKKPQTQSPALDTRV